MKKILLVFMLAVVFFLPMSLSAHASSQAEVVQRVDSDIETANGLISDIEAVRDDSAAILQVLLRDIPAVTQHWDESSIFYESIIALETNDELKAILTNIDNEVKGLSSSLSRVGVAINSSDEDLYNSAFDEYDNHITVLNSNISLLNNYYGVSDYSWLAWPFWIALIISVVLFIMSRGSPILPAEQLRNQFEFALFKSSLWPLVGSAVSYFWYLSTPPGGTFYVLYGPIAIGYFQFFRGLYTYITGARPAINLAKKEEKSKLEALIRSDRFQKENMEEKIKEIESRKPVIHIGKK